MSLGPFAAANHSRSNVSFNTAQAARLTAMDELKFYYHPRPHYYSVLKARAPSRARSLKVSDRYWILTGQTRRRITRSGLTPTANQEGL